MSPFANLLVKKMTLSLGEKIKLLIGSPKETKNCDYKGSFIWDKNKKDTQLGLVKDIMAMSNTKGGGILIIGVEDKSYILKGLNNAEYESFDQTKINDLIKNYSDPEAEFYIHKVEIEGKKIVAIIVKEFAECPIICKKTPIPVMTIKNRS